MLCKPFPRCVHCLPTSLELPRSWILCPIPKSQQRPQGDFSPAGRTHFSVACFPVLYAKKGFFLYTLTILKGLLRKGGSCKQDTQRHKPSRQTQWRQRWERNFVTDANWWAVKMLQVTWDFVTDVEANAQVLDIGGGGGGGGLMKLQTGEGVCRGRGSGRKKGGIARKGYTRGHLGVNQGWSVCLSDPTLRLVTAVCLSSYHTLS